MKTCLMLLALSLSALCYGQSVVTVRLTNMGNMVNLEIRNSNNFDISCQGMVYLHIAHGLTDSQYYSSRILGGLIGVRTLWLHHQNDWVSYSNHSIYCTEAK